MLLEAGRAKLNELLGADQEDDARDSPKMAPSHLADAALVAVLLLAAGIYAAQADHRLEPGNADYYLRNASVYADGGIAHSRYSPGLGVLLMPLVWLAGDNLSTLTFLAELALVPFAVAGIFLLHQFLRVYLRPWLAVCVVAVFALGQAASVFLTGIESEPVALFLVSGALLALAQERHNWAVAMGTLAMLVRIAVVPFFLVVWLLLSFRRRQRRPALIGLALSALAVAAHFASAPIVDQTYLNIGGATGGRGSAFFPLELVEAAFQATLKYLRYGIPRLLLPYRSLRTPIGPVLAALVLVPMLLGVWELWRRRRVAVESGVWTARVSVLAFGAILASLLLWPVRDGESTRLLIPFVGVPLLALGKGVEKLKLPNRLQGWLTSLIIGAVLAAATLVPTASVLRQRNQRPRSEANFVLVHNQLPRLADDAVLSRKPAYTELVTGRRSYAYPAAADSSDLTRLIERQRVCTVVIDEMAPFPDGFVDWVGSVRREVVARVENTTIVALQLPWC